MRRNISMNSDMILFMKYLAETDKALIENDENIILQKNKKKF